MSETNTKKIQVEVVNDGFHVSYYDALILISDKRNKFWQYEFYKQVDDSAKMEPACAPFNANGVPWQQSRYKDSLFVACMQTLLFSEKEETQKLVQEIITEIYKVHEEYTELHEDSDYEETTESETEEVPEEIKNEAQKIINEGRALDYITNFIGYSYFGEIPQRKLVILSTATLAVLNVDEAPHMHYYGDPEVGKSYLFRLNKDIIPSRFVFPDDSFSPKTLFYAEVKPRLLIVINDAIIGDDLGQFLNNACDKTAWESGFSHGTVINHEYCRKQLPSGVLIHLSTNKTIQEYKVDNVDTSATATRFYSYNKKYSDEQKKEILKHIYNKKLPDDYEVQKQISKEIYNILLSNPKIIKNEMKWEDIEVLIPTGLRSPQRILTLLKCHAIMRGSSKVEKIDIEEISKLMNEVVSDDVQITKDAPIILDNLPTEETFKNWDIDKNLKTIVEICSKNNIAKRVGLKSSTLNNRLYALRDKGLVERAQNPKNYKELLWYRTDVKENSEIILKLLGVQTIEPEKNENGVIIF